MKPLSLIRRILGLLLLAIAAPTAYLLIKLCDRP
ncbi:hypothetical protein SAMN06265337_0666 [Hymenobacter gelipurpurascens]|uniref:Uncharacterized protein n=1 Tax=Hymenobacter gelipurpurascens TaxID=89968 RepID=A0A212T981_9BACT|nr:hypothetical protein SAMN06265337_0666 [Hymenobacter gelipurpurascens]